MGGCCWIFSQFSVQQGGGAQLELWVLGSCLHLIPEPQLPTQRGSNSLGGVDSTLVLSS